MRNELDGNQVVPETTKQVVLEEQDMRDRVHLRGNILFEDISIQSTSYPFTLLYPILFLIER
jgi:hypothetical protein